MEIANTIAAVLGGGAIFTFISKMVELWLNKGKSVRDELREEIARLEARIQVLSTKVDTLENEIESWKARVDDWRNKYYALVEEHHLLKLADAEKSQFIEALQLELAGLRGETINATVS